MTSTKPHKVKNRLDALPEDLQKRIWTYYLANRLKKLLFLQHSLSIQRFNLRIREPNVVAKLVGNDLLFISEVCGVDACVFRNPLERWWGQRCGHVLRATVSGPTYLPPWYPLTSAFFSECHPRALVDVLCIDATHSQIEYAGKRVHNIPILNYSRALSDLKRKSPYLRNAEITIEDFKSWYPSLFGSLEDAKQNDMGRLRQIKRSEQKALDDKVDKFVNC